LQCIDERMPRDEVARMIDGVTNAGAMPVLERLVQFAGQRHRLIVHNIANIDTPEFRPLDVSAAEFQRQLGEAIDARRAGKGLSRHTLPLEDTRQITFESDTVRLHPEPAADNILFHDQNDRDVERIMQDLVENFMAFRTASDLIKNRFNLINTAIRERL
jgi:flagellar basal-body rod protein FlgB